MKTTTQYTQMLDAIEYFGLKGVWTDVSDDGYSFPTLVRCEDGMQCQNRGTYVCFNKGHGTTHQCTYQVL